MSNNSLVIETDGPSGAMFSGDRLYRYRLHRLWSDAPKIATFVMLNPSTADATKNDPTVAKCMLLAGRWGCGGLIVVNLFALRSTDPAALIAHPDPIGSQNDDVIRHAVRGASLVVAAWGNHGSLRNRAATVAKTIRDMGIDLVCLDINVKTGQPKHPLYCRSDTQHRPYAP